MVTQIIDLLNLETKASNDEYIKIARGKYKNPTTITEAFRKAFRKFKNIE